MQAPMSVTPEPMEPINIIIPHWGGSDGLNQLALECLQSIREHTTDYSLIWVDNGSPVKSGPLEEELQEHPGATLRNAENLGFVKAVNQGIRYSTAPFVVIMNNDTMAVPRWAEKLQGALVGRAGISGPRTDAQESWQGRWARSNGRNVTLKPGAMLAFFCAMFRREVFEKVGYLDESYGAGLGDDDEFCRRAQRAKFDLVLVRDLLIPHRHRSTFKTIYTPGQIDAMQTSALQRFHSTG